MSAQSLRIILHPAFERALIALKKSFEDTIRGQLIFVVGLSGAGKSEIRYSQMRAFAGPAKSWGKGHLPAIAVRATPSNRSYFSPKEFMTRVYMELIEPDVGWLRDRSEIGDPDVVHLRADGVLRSPIWMDIKRNLTEHKTRGYVERLAVERYLRGMFIEEGASLTYNHRDKSPVDHMISLMCLAEQIDVTMAFFGVPKMAQLWEGDAQIRRRSRFIYVDRYRLDKLEDRRIFERLVMTISSRYRFSRQDTVRKCMDLLYVCSAGTYGELKNYLRRADDIRAIEKEPAITKQHLEHAVHSEVALKALYKDVELFDLLQQSASAAIIRRILGCVS